MTSRLLSEGLGKIRPKPSCCHAAPWRVRGPLARLGAQGCRCGRGGPTSGATLCAVSPHRGSDAALTYPFASSAANRASASEISSRSPASVRGSFANRRMVRIRRMRWRSQVTSSSISLGTRPRLSEKAHRRAPLALRGRHQVGGRANTRRTCVACHWPCPRGGGRPVERLRHQPLPNASLTGDGAAALSGRRGAYPGQGRAPSPGRFSHGTAPHAVWQR
jgi:hypothetical protein